MSDLDQLLAVLDLEVIEVNIFRGVSPREQRQRVFGGQVAGQALVAAGRTVDPDAEGRPRQVHSLHAYFLRPGDVDRPILYEVDRIRDGRSFTTRRVVAIQGGKAIFNLSASFHVAEAGVDHQLPMPDAPDPEGLLSMRERFARFEGDLGEFANRAHPIDVRYVGDPPLSRPAGALPPQKQVWLRADGRLPDDPLLHACVVAYASDMTLLDTIMLPHELVWDGGHGMASLDHAMWFHRPFRADEWLLYDQVSPSASAARGLATGRIFRSDGALAISVVQEGMLRVPHPVPSMDTVTLTLPRRELTSEDLDGLPDDGRRYELLDGVLLVSPAPFPLHQVVLSRLHVLLQSAIDATGRGGELIALEAPVDYRISASTLLQPDLLVVRFADLAPDRMRGTPVLVAEVLSRSTRHLDRGAKRLAYAEAGVPAYWIVDPAGPSVTVLNLESGSYTVAAEVAGDQPWTDPELGATVIPSLLVVGPTRLAQG